MWRCHHVIDSEARRRTADTRAWIMDHRSLGLRTFIVAIALGFSGCTSGPWHDFPVPGPQALTWPLPPERARVVFLMQIRSHTDLFRSAGRWGWFGRLIAGEPDSALVRPYALALHPDGGLLVTDPGRRKVHFFDWTRRRYVAIGDRIQGGLPSPVGVAVLPDGRILVSDSRLARIKIFDVNGRPLGEFGADGLLGRPAGIAVVPDRREIYVVDVIRHRVVVFDFNGALLRSIGERGSGPGEFNFPTHIAATADGRLAVTDSLNFRVQVLEADGTFVREVGRLGDSPGRFSKPKGVAATRAGELIVVEGLYDRLEFFSAEGQLLLDIGRPGSGPGEFWLPAGLCLDRSTGRVFIADTFNQRVQVLQLLGHE